MRALIHAAAPTAEECVGYGLAAFRLAGKLLAGIAACRGYCSYYPMSGRTIVTLRKELAAFETTSGAIHFTPEQPLSAALVRKLVRTRAAELRGTTPKRSRSPRATARRRERSSDTAV